MATTTFTDNQTVIYAAWLNDVNNAVYNGSFPNGILNPTTVNCTNLNATNATITNLAATFGNFAITPVGTKLYFTYLGTNIASLDSSGNFISLGNNTANTHVSSTSPTP
jgi:hypothetical protein